MSVAGTTWSRSGTRRRGSGSERRAACQAKWRSSRCRGWTKDRRISSECVPRTIRAAVQRWRRRLKPRPRTRSVISTPRVFYLSPSRLRCRACVDVVYWRSVITGITCQEVKIPFGCTFYNFWLSFTVMFDVFAVYLKILTFSVVDELNSLSK